MNQLKQSEVLQVLARTTSSYDPASLIHLFRALQMREALVSLLQSIEARANSLGISKAVGLDQATLESLKFSSTLSASRAYSEEYRESILNGNFRIYIELVGHGGYTPRFTVVSQQQQSKMGLNAGEGDQRIDTLESCAELLAE